MIVLLYGVLIFVALSGATHAESFDNRDTLIYDDLGCLLASSNNQVAYNCDNAFSNNCVYRGKKYEVGQVIPPQDALLSCSTSCRCKSNGFVCSNLRCPEIGGVTLANKACYHIYSLAGCCNQGEICPPLDKVPTCNVDGKIYLKGQKFFPKNTSLHCVCDAGFEGNYEKYCRKIVCGIELKYNTEIKNRCAPFYEDSDQRNCPSSWICPSEQDDDTIIKTDQGGNDSAKCSYGKQILNVGDYFERKELRYAYLDGVTKCECLIPPLLTCGLTHIASK